MKNIKLPLLMAILLMAGARPVFAQWQLQNLPATAEAPHVPKFGFDNSIWFRTQEYLGKPDVVTPIETLTSKDGGLTFQKGTFLSDGAGYFTDLFPMDGQTAFMIVGGNENLLKKTTDGGQSWQSTPFQPVTFPDLIHFWDNNNGILIGDPDDQGFYIGFTTDGGNHFTRLDNAALPATESGSYSAPGVFSIVGDRIFMGVALANGNWKMWRSLNRGHTWQVGEEFSTTDFYLIGSAFVDDNRGMMKRGNHETSIKPLFTEDGGMTWHEAHADLPGYSEFAFTNVPGTEDVLGFFYDNSDGMVFSALTNDLGQSWNTFRDIAPGVLDSLYLDAYGINPFIFTNISISDNHHAWGSIQRGKWRKYSAAQPIVPENPDLELSMAADNPNLDLYSSQKFTLTIRNRGIAKGTKIKVNWLPPYKRTPGAIAPYALQAGYADLGHFNEWDGIWDIPELGPGQSATATFHLFVLQDNQNVAQTAQITACQELDIDSQVNNMSGPADEDDEVGFTSLSFSTDDPATVVREKWAGEVSVAPNPAADFTEIYFNLPEPADVRLELVDVFGRVLLSKELPGVKTGAEPIDLNGLPSGFYFARTTISGDQQRVAPILIQKSF